MQVVTKPYQYIDTVWLLIWVGDAEVDNSNETLYPNLPHNPIIY